MIPVSILDNEYINRPKLSEQKNSFENIVPPPQVKLNLKNCKHTSKIAIGAKPNHDINSKQFKKMNRLFQQKKFYKEANKHESYNNFNPQKQFINSKNGFLKRIDQELQFFRSFNSNYQSMQTLAVIY